MKCLHHILVLGLLLAVMVKCGNSPDSSVRTGTPSQSGTAALEALEEIDSLMWKQPDSALTVMLKFAASPEADSLDDFEEHYCQMLISELLYKNDYEQSNREELLNAVDYFDSIVAADGYKTDSRRDAPRASAKNVQNTAFLDARAHYINGVGFYERGDVVNACAEYLKTLEVMEANFEEKELVGHKARFMAYTYNRLGDLFEELLLAESAISCYKQALFFCRRETTSKYGIPVLLYRLGIQYDIIGQKDSAAFFYDEALAYMPDFNNLHYRDLMANKALFDYYNSNYNSDSIINGLKQLVALSIDEGEKTTRSLTLGNLLFEEKQYDSSRVYLETVFEQKEDITSKIIAAQNLCNIYQMEGDSIKAQKYASFLVGLTMSEMVKKADVSKVNEMFKDYLTQKQEKHIEEEREKSIMRVIKIIVPIAIVIALAVFIVVKLRSKHLLKQQQEKADRMLGETEQEHEKELRLWQAEADKTLEETKRKYEEELEQLKTETEQQLEKVEMKHQQWMAKAKERHEKELREQKDKSEKEMVKTKMRHVEELEAERNAYQKEREELERSLRQSKENVNALQKELGRKRTGAAEHYAAFLEESVCAKINGLVRDLHITTRKPYSHYHISLDDDTIAQLSEVVTVHYGELKPTLQCLYPGISHEDLLLCYLYLLGLSNKQIAVLRQRDYSTVRKQAKELMGKLRIDETVRDYVLDVAGVEEFVEK